MLTRATALVRRTFNVRKASAQRPATSRTIGAPKRPIPLRNCAPARFYCYGQKIWIPTMHEPNLHLSTMPSLQTPPPRANQLIVLLNRPEPNNKDIVALLREMITLKSPIEPQTVQKLFSKLVSLKKFETLAIVRSLLLTNGLYTSETYHMYLNACRRYANLDEAIEVYRWWHNKTNSPFLQFELLLLLEMHATPSLRLPHEATKLFREFIDQGLRNVLGTAGFNELLEVWASVGPSGLVDDQLRAIFEEMTIYHQSNAPTTLHSAPETQEVHSNLNRHSCRPNSRTYRILVSNLQDLSLVEHYYRMALRERRTSPQVHERYLYRLCEAKQKTKALKWYKRMLEHPVWRNEINAETLLTVLHFCTLTGDMASMSSIFTDATELGITHTTAMYASLITLCARMKNTEMAENILVVDLPRHGLEIDENIYSALIMLYCAVDNLSKAVTLYQEMRATACKLLPNTLTPLIIAHFENAKLLQNSEMEAQGQHFWEERKAIREKPTLNLLISIFVNSIDTAFLSSLVQGLLPFLDGIQPLHALARRTLYLGDQLAPERALFLFHQFSSIPEFRVEHWMYDLLFNKLVGQDMLETAFELAQEAVEIAFYLNWDLASPRQLKWTSHVCIEKTKALGYPFHLTDTHASLFFNKIVVPNGFKSSTDWALTLDPVAKKPWSKEAVFAWSAELSLWKSQIEPMNPSSAL